MAIHWRLKTYVASQHGIFSAVDLQKKIILSTGVIISAQNLRMYLNGKPKSIPLRTMELICTALQCDLSQFLDVKPKPPARGKVQPKKLSFLNTPIKKRGNGESFPNPTDYES